MMIKKNTLLIIFCLISLNIFSQSKEYLQFIPSNLNSSNVQPSDIPSEQVLRGMGLTEDEIKEAIDFKFSKGKYSPDYKENPQDNLKKKSINKSSNLYFSLTDTILDSLKYPVGKVFGQDIFRSNNLSFYNKAYDAQPGENYLLGAGDELTISIWGMANHSETVVVNEKGYISTQIAGRIYVGNKSFTVSKSLIKNRMSNFYDLSRSQLDVSLNYSRVINVNIIGEVFNPGSYSIPATNTVFNALIACGGPSQIGSVRNIYLMRNGQVVDSLDVYDFLFNADGSKDLFMQNNDYIFIPPAQNIVEVKGSVNRPYTYEAKSNEKLSDIIRYAGGFTSTAYIDGIEVRRIKQNNIIVITADRVSSRNLSIKNGDEIIINEILGIPSKVVKVHSSTSVSGNYEFITGETVYDLLAKSNSLGTEKYMEKAYLVRTQRDFTKEYIVLDLESLINNPLSDQNIELQEYDELFILSVRDFIDDFSIEINGAVRNPGTFPYGESAKLGDLIFLSGGITQESAGGKIEISRALDYDDLENQISILKRTQVYSVNIPEDGNLSSEILEYNLKPFDVISIRENKDYEKPRSVNIQGAVNYPGKYILLSKNETVKDLIKRAGGLKSNANKSSAKMYRMTNVQDGEISMIEYYKDDQEIVNGFYSNGKFVQIIPTSEEEDEMLNEHPEFKNIYIPLSVDLQKVYNSPNSKYNILLEDLDSLYVPSSNNTVTISGALQNLDDHSISTPFIGKRANFYVNNFAGGFTKHNIKQNTHVIYSSGKVKKAVDLGLFILYPKVEPGATIHVTEDVKIKRKAPEPVNWTKVLESTVTKITAIASLYILYLSQKQ